MVRHYLKTALRNFGKNRIHSVINLLGLALGLSACLLLLQYTSYELSYDNFHEKAGRIYRLRLDGYQNGQLAWKSATSYPAIVPTMKKDFPEVVNGCRLYDAEGVLINRENNTFFVEKKGYFADSSFLQMFDLHLAAGDPEASLKKVNTMIVSESFARKYFGPEDALHRTLVLRSEWGIDIPLEITGVFADYPANSHLVIDYMVSMATLADLIRNSWGENENVLETSWGWYDFYSYVELRPGVDPQALEAKFPAMWERYTSDRIIPGTRWNELYLQPLPDIHLYSNINQEAEVNGNGRAIYALLIIAFAILAIAWINYINLATARAVERAREVGVRKTLGAVRSQLLGQFLAESMLLNLLALVVAVGLVQVLLPYFQDFTGRTVGFDLYRKPAFWIGAAAVFLAGSLGAGLYPALVLSSFRPATIFNQMDRGGRANQFLRRALVVAQFSAAIVLIAGTFIVQRQIRYMRQQELGLDTEQTLVVNGPTGIVDSVYGDLYNRLNAEWRRVPGVGSITASTIVPGEEIYWTNGIRRLGTESESSTTTLYHVGVDYEFFEAYDLPLVAGRVFSESFGEDERAAILNETAVATLGLGTPQEAVGQRILRGSSDTLLVIGVARNFHQMGLQKAHDPLLLLLRPNASRFYSLKVETADLPGLMARLEGVWRQSFPEQPFSYFFLDDFFDEQYRADRRFGRVFGAFAGLAVFIACLGLFGLASYNVLQRTKEIGIRKVLGASVGSLVLLLSRDFVRLMGLALLMAFPLAWFVMSRWLETYAFRIELAWWMFALPAALALLIALATISLQSVRAALANPVEALRDE